MPQTGVSVRRGAPAAGRTSEPHLVLARDAAAEDMAEIARSGVPRDVRRAGTAPYADRPPGPTSNGRRPRLDLVPDRPAPNPPRAANGGVPGRRTVTITGQGAGVYPARRRPQRPIHQRPGFQPDRFAMWAVLLGVLLVVIAAMSAHA